MPHNVSVTRRESGSEVFNVGTEPHQKYVHTFDRVGQFDVKCDIHEGMEATVIVARGPMTTIAGDDGRFSFPNVAFGSYKVSLTFSGQTVEQAARRQRRAHRSQAHALARFAKAARRRLRASGVVLAPHHSDGANDELAHSISSRSSLVVALVACADTPHAQPQSGPAADIAELWQEPTDLLAARSAAAARAARRWRRRRTARSNSSPSRRRAPIPATTCKDASGRHVEREARHRGAVGSDRVAHPVGDGLSAAGDLFRPAVHAHRRRRRREDQRAVPHRHSSSGASTGEWSWYENPFVNTQPFRGLDRRADGAEQLGPEDRRTTGSTKRPIRRPVPRRQFMVRDVGSSLGHSKQFRLFAMLGTRGRQGSKNDVDDFEQQGFIEKVEGNKVELRLSRHEPGAGRHGHRAPT